MPLSNLSADLRISNSHDNVRSLAQATAPRGGLVPFAEAYIEDLSALQSGQYRVAIDVRRRTRITYRQANLKREHTSLKSDTPRKLLRRDLLKLTIGGVGAVSVGELLRSPVSAKPVDLDQKRKARYRPDSREVRNFYRVNGYPAAR